MASSGYRCLAYTDPFGLAPDADCCEVEEAVAIGSGVGAAAGVVVAAGCAGSTGGVCAAAAPEIVGVFTGIGASAGGLVGTLLEMGKRDKADEGHTKVTPSKREKHENAKRRPQRLKEKKRQHPDWKQKGGTPLGEDQDDSE